MNEAGIQHELQRTAERLVIDAGAAPGASLALGVVFPNGVRIASAAAGRLTRSASSPAVETSTPFDLASVTKPLLALTAARLAKQGMLDFRRPLGELLLEARGTPSEHVPLELLLAHRAGLEAHRPLYAPLESKRPFERARALVHACRARRADCAGPVPEHGFPPLYSDLGFLLAGAALERLSGRPLDALVAEQVSAPLHLDLGSARQWLGRDRSFFSRVAPTENVRWRGGELQGIVHDENAWAFCGHGMAGHAGLFGTARSLAELGARLLVFDPAFLSQAELEPLVRVRPGGTLRAGFDGRSEGASASGTRSGPRTFGHLGFTGTSFWCDPDHGIVSVLLTHRVCPSRADVRLRAVRPRVQDALHALAERWRG